MYTVDTVAPYTVLYALFTLAEIIQPNMLFPYPFRTEVIKGLHKRITNRAALTTILISNDIYDYVSNSFIPAQQGNKLHNLSNVWREKKYCQPWSCSAVSVVAGAHKAQSSGGLHECLFVSCLAATVAIFTTRTQFVLFSIPPRSLGQGSINAVSSRSWARKQHCYYFPGFDTCTPSSDCFLAGYPGSFYCT